MMYAGLTKVIAINSYQKNKMFSEYYFDSPTQITGGNGEGKTSLLRLIPFFYGATGTQIVRKSNVNKPFVEWYLPHSNSYIVFEYITARGQVAHVICYRNLSTKGGIVYLFVKGQFEQSVIIKQDSEEKPYAIACTKLAAELAVNGLDYESRITNVKEYREIIQNINAGTLNNQFLSYSLCSGRHDVRHIEKITAALIQGEFNMADTKALFLDILEQGNSTLEFGVDANRIEQWCDDYSGLTAFLDKKDAFIEAIANNQQIAYLTTQLANALTIIREASENLDESRKKADLMRADFLENSDRKIGEINEKKLDKEVRQNALQRSITSIESEIDVHHSKLITYENNGYPELSVKLKQLPEMEDKVTHQRQSYADLEIKFNDAKAKHEKDKQSLVSKFNKEKSDLIEQKLDAEKEFKVKKDKIDAVYQPQLKELTEYHTSFTTDKSSTLMKRKADLATQKQRLKNPDIDELLIEQREQLELEKDRLQEEVDTLKHTTLVIEKEGGNLQTKREKLLESLEDTRRNKRDAEARFKVVSNRLDPDSGTLFSFLEANRQGWQSSPLGRILTDELLMDTTLTPSMTEDSGSMYDLYIDTSNLADCSVTNKADLEEQANLMDLIDELDDAEIDFNKKISKNNSAVKQSGLELSRLRNELRNAEGDLAQTKVNLNNKKIEIARAKEGLIEKINISIKSIEKAISQTEREVSLALERFKEAKLELNNDRLTQIGNIESSLALTIGAIDELLAKSTLTLGENKQRIKTEYEQRLSKQGISGEIYQRYKEEIEFLDNQIKNLKAKSHKIKEYETWIAVYEVDDPKRRDDRNTKVKELEAVHQEVKSLETKLIELRVEANRTKKEFDEKLSILKNHKQRADSAISRLTNYVMFEDEEGSQEENDYNGDLNSLLNDVESKLPELERLTKQRKKDIQQMETITLNLGDGELYRFWNESSRNTITEDIVASDSKRIDILEIIMNDIIPQVTRITIESAVNMGRMLVDFKHRLLGFDRDIKKLGRNISEQVKVNNTFSVVGSIDINVESSLSKLQGWEDIINFSEIYEEWDKTGSAELPTKEFYNALDTLTYHISAEKVKKPTELFDIKFEVIENNQRKTAKTDKDMRDLASNGTNLLIQSMLYLALLTQQRGASRLSITYPTDEIGKLTAENQAKLLKMMGSHNFNVIAAQPDGNNRTANLFKYLYHLTPYKNIFNKPKVSKLALAKAAETSTGVEA
ncbi:ATP-binding protein [Photobacterium phosphoreum]|uniref:ATP-binding protein n=1 Tax=Photobacterium phosphoreum TaxID=659 RepID=UPI000CF4A00E|nr:ATP-binding protein [Photobacterium phosphoreum]PQJ91379.1 ATP-binding protein [Photobacterium phosphoreum]PSV69747.1 ATP-binding protein [Photobacterium phosphoreum]